MIIDRSELIRFLFICHNYTLINIQIDDIWHCFTQIASICLFTSDKCTKLGYFKHLIKEAAFFRPVTDNVNK